MARRGNRRQEILTAALDLFNRSGEANISTNHIADELSISPGNLYYHFSNKQAIVDEIFSAFEAEMNELLVAPEDKALSLEEMWLFLHILFETIWKFRFLYYDLSDLIGRNETIRKRFHRIISAKRASAVAVCQALRKAGTMQIDDAAIRSLSTNIVVIMTFWLNFQSLMEGPEAEAEDNLAPAIYHVMVLVAPYLEAGPRSELIELAEAYLD